MSKRRRARRSTRVILTELNRIASHLLWLGTHALDIGAITPVFYCFREREEVLKIFENYCGARLTTHAFRIGGLQYELYDGFEEQVNAFCDMFLPKVDEYEELLTNNRIWVDRLKGVGILSGRRVQGVRRHRARAARRRREVGPAQGAALFRLRAVRFRYSHRRERRHLRPVPGAHGGDAAIGAHHPPGGGQDSRRSDHGQDAKVVKPATGEAYVSIEAPKGELGYFVVSDNSTQPYRVRVRPPSFVNLQALDRMVRGGLVADVVAIIGTLDIVLGKWTVVKWTIQLWASFSEPSSWSICSRGSGSRFAIRIRNTSTPSSIRPSAPRWPSVIAARRG